MSLNENLLTGNFVSIAELWTVKNRENKEFIFVPSKIICGNKEINCLVKLVNEDLVEKIKNSKLKHPFKFRASGNLVLINADIDKKIDYVFGLSIAEETHYLNEII